jgi:predicted Zn-dependent protease
VSALTNIVDIRYTREQEREADYLGMYAAHQAGFNVEAAPALWERFAVATPESMNDSFFKNHPPSTERLVRVQKTVEEIRQGRTVQQVWNGDFSETQVASSTRDSAASSTAKTSTASSTDSTP